MRQKTKGTLVFAVVAVVSLGSTLASGGLGGKADTRPSLASSQRPLEPTPLRGSSLMWRVPSRAPSHAALPM